MRVSTGNYEREHGKAQFAISFLPFFQQDGMDVALKMVNCDKRLVEREGERLGIANADEERSCKAGTLGYSDGIERLVSFTGFRECLSDDRNDGAQMLA